MKLHKKPKQRQMQSGERKMTKVNEEGTIESLMAEAGKVNELVSAVVIDELRNKDSEVTGVGALIGLSACLGKTIALVAHVENIEESDLEGLVSVLMSTARDNFEQYSERLRREGTAGVADESSQKEKVLWV